MALLQRLRGNGFLTGTIRAGLAGSYGRLTAVFLFFLAIAVVETWPLVLHLTDRVVDSDIPNIDVYSGLWDIVWIKRAVLDLQTNPYETDYLFYPDGEHLYLHSLTLINGLMAIPLEVVTGNLFLSWNLLGLVFFALSGVATYALAYRFTNNHAAALLAGFVFAFSPWVMVNFNGRWNVSTVWPIPMFVLLLVRFLDKGRLLDAAGAGILWTVLTYNNQEFGIDSGVFFGLFLLYWSIVLIRQRNREKLQAFWRGGAVVTITWLALSAPLLIPAWSDSRSGQYAHPPQDEYYSADVLSFFTPSPLWGPGKHPNSGPVPPHDVVGGTENTVYLGAVPLVLATLAFVTFRRSPEWVLFWGIVFVAFAILMLGPRLYVDGVKRSSIPLPYELYNELPVVGVRRAPSRMFPFAMLGLTMLSAVGLDFIMSWLRKHFRVLVPVAAVIFLAVVFVEYWNPPAHLSALPRPEALKEIRDEPGDFTVLDAPLGRRDGWLFNGHLNGSEAATYYASVHERRTFGGLLSRISENTRAWLRKEPGLRHLAFPWEPPLADDLDPSAVKAVFSKYHIKYVILHRIGAHGQAVDTPEQLDAIDAYLRQVVGVTPVESEPSMTIYRNGDIP